MNNCSFDSIAFIRIEFVVAIEDVLGVYFNCLDEHDVLDMYFLLSRLWKRSGSKKGEGGRKY